jgi:dipeptidyl-peptidase-4
LSDADGKNEKAITTDGSVAARIKNGVASWVYGEELEVREAMWFSPDGKKLAYYRFDESEVKDYYIAMDQTKFQATLDTEPYPKAGQPNPKVQLWIYDLASGERTRVDSDFDDKSLGEYVYDVRWSDDSSELYYARTNRKQNVMQFCAANPTSGASRRIAEERQPQSWAENHPTVQWLTDKRRFIWSTEKNGYKNFDLYGADGKRIAEITKNQFDANRILAVDEKSNLVYFLAAGPENPYFEQLYCVGLYGKNQKLLTDPKFHHSVSLSPTYNAFVDIQQTPDTPARTVLQSIGKSSVKAVATLATPDDTKFKELQLKPTEVFTFTAADGKTQLYGTLQKPSDFDPTKKYPVIVDVYGGPESGGMNPSFRTPSPLTELGFLVVNIAGRGTMGRGKAFRDAVYGKLGVVEIDDQAAGVQALATREYVDGKRVGIYGTSYGGYASAMAILRHPETFWAACASSSVTAWQHYDSIYTERYMGLPGDGENQAGYDNGSAMKYAGDLKGHLMLYFGSADNNVHPSNTYMLVNELEKKGKRYDMQVGPDRGHTQMNSTRIWEYFIKWLILDPATKPQRATWNGRTASSRLRVG